MPTRLRLPLVAVALLSASTSAHALPAFARRFNLARGPTPRSGLAVPEHASIYLAGPLTTSTSLFVELENTVHETDINKRGDFVNSDTGGMQKAFLMVDLPMLFGLHGGMDHEMHHAMGHEMSDMDMGMATMGDGLVGHGPMVMIGRVDPSTNFSYAVDRQLFHDVPADTSERGFLLRLGLAPYAFGAKFFGIFKRGDHTLLPTEPTLYNTEAAPGVDVHGRLFASKVLYQFGLTTDAAPEFLDRIHTAAPYVMLRYDFGDQDGLNGSVSVLGNYGRNAYRVFYLAPAPLPVIPLAVPEETLREPTLPEPPVPLHRPPPPPGRGFIAAQQDLDVWREGIGWNLRRGPWDAYGAYTYDQVYDIPARLVLSLRDSVNLTPGGSHPFGAWRNALLLGFDFAF